MNKLQFINNLVNSCTNKRLASVPCYYFKLNVIHFCHAQLMWAEVLKYIICLINIT
jgi:hypothetical protein